MGLLISLKKTLYVWWFELRCILLSSRFLVFSLVSFLLVHFYMRETLEFARDYDLNMYPAAISFLFADGTFSCLGILLAIFMLSVFPVTNHLLPRLVHCTDAHNYVSGCDMADGAADICLCIGWWAAGFFGMGKSMGQLCKRHGKGAWLSGGAVCPEGCPYVIPAGRGGAFEHALCVSDGSLFWGIYFLH